jgi:hypothetical protein
LSSMEPPGGSRLKSLVEINVQSFKG